MWPFNWSLCTLVAVFSVLTWNWLVLSLNSIWKYPFYFNILWLIQNESFSMTHIYESYEHSADLDDIHADMKFLPDFHLIDVAFKIFDHLWLLKIWRNIFIELIVRKFNSSFFGSIDPEAMVKTWMTMTIFFNKISSKTGPLATNLWCSFINLSLDDKIVTDTINLRIVS